MEHLDVILDQLTPPVCSFCKLKGKFRGYEIRPHRASLDRQRTAEILSNMQQRTKSSLTFSSLAVTLHTARFNIKKFYIAFMCFVWILEQTATFAL
jgi:hypothetical protein